MVDNDLESLAGLEDSDDDDLDYSDDYYILVLSDNFEVCPTADAATINYTANGEAGWTYKWFDVATGRGTPIDTDIVFEASSTGNFYIEVTANGITGPRASFEITNFDFVQPAQFQYIG
jgi:hypothetical protein